MRFLVNIIIMTIAVYVAASLLPGVMVADFLTSLVVAVVLALLNAIVKPVLVFLTIPFTIITFGLFLLVINAVVVLLADRLISGFEVAGFWWALLFSLIMSLIQWLFAMNGREK
jgi:putative membrane protein